MNNIFIDISFCLPVYNVKPFLEECINSILSQNIKVHYEIVCVDDCSMDGSYEKLLEMAQGNERIVVIQNSSNKGVSYTRNFAVKSAKGKYIWFIDPDDMLYPDIVNSFIDTIVNNEADVALGNYLRICEEFHGNIQKKQKVIFEKELDVLELPRDSEGNRMCAIWAGLFRREFLVQNNLFFKENMISQEDTLFYYEVEQHNPKVIKTNAICYLYRQRRTSVMHAKSEQRTRAYLQSLKIMLDVYLTYWNEKKYRDEEVLKRKIHHSQENIVVCLAMCSNISFIHKELKELRRQGLYPYKFRNITLASNAPIIKRLFDYMMPIPLCFWIVHFIYSLVNKYKYSKYKRMEK